MAAAAHVFYELAAGVGMPFASRVGPRPAAALWGAGTALALSEAGRRPSSHDGVFLALDATYLAAVLAHFAAWPRTRVLGLPWLTECEGLTGSAIRPYNAILYASAVTALGGLLENRRGIGPGAAVPLLLVPALMRLQHDEVSRLREQAQRDPGWWNRRLR